MPPRKAAPPNRYYALVVPGIEDLAAKELRRAGACDVGVLSAFDKRDSLVLFETDDARRLLHCSLIEDVFTVLLEMPVPSGRSAPNVLARCVQRPALDAALLAHHALTPRQRGRSYKVVTRVAGRHPFRRDETDAAFGRAIGALLPHWVRSENAAIEVWAHIIGGRAIVGLRLSGDDLAQRRYKRAHTAASLKPTVARALVELTDPRPDDVFLDPMCGAGTILRERADAGRARRIIGGDLERSAIAAACENVGKNREIVRWDARHLPLRDATVDVMALNPPYGRRHAVSGGTEALYRSTMRESVRVLRPGGRCVVLTGEPAVFARALPRRLHVSARRRILLRGLPATAFVMVRT